jgi:hypothetical protein
VCMNQHNRFLCELKIPQNLDSDPTNNFWSLNHNANFLI